MAHAEKCPRCPVCKTTDFDISKDGKEGFCIVGCGTHFEILKNNITKKVGYIKIEALEKTIA